jgi:uncharacterized integral membrane protein (TIGR00697 family)
MNPIDNVVSSGNVNDIVAVLSFLALAMLVVTAARLGTIALFVLSATFILLSNVTVGMSVQVFGVIFPWAILVYSLVYLVTYLICEFHGQKMAYKLAVSNVAVQVILWGYVWTSMLVSPIPDGIVVRDAMESLFATTKQISVAALLASIGPILGVYIFGRIRRKWEQMAVRHNEDVGIAGALLRNNTLAVVVRNKLAAFAGQIINTIVFFTIADFNTRTATSVVLGAIASFSAVKMVVSMADVPFLIVACRQLTIRKSLTSTRSTIT